MEACLLLVVAPRCGELARRLLASRGLQPRRLKPLKDYAPARRAALFPLSGVDAEARELAAAGCGGLAELVYAACAARRETPEPPVSYTLIGPVAVVSLDERLRGREREVAEQLLRIPGVRAVYGKEATVGEYRVQRLIHLAGEELGEVVYREHGLSYIVPLGRVYVNPRLATEHARVAGMVEPGEAVLDMFSGIGGFSLLISSQGRARLVVANDANPWAAWALLRSARANRGRLRSPLVVVNEYAENLPSLLRPVFDRVVMNLPHSSTRYLGVAERLCSPRGCWLHVYVLAGSREEALSKVPGAVSASRVLDYSPSLTVYRVDARRRGVGDQEGVADRV